MKKCAIVLICILSVCSIVLAEEKKTEQDYRSVKIETWLVSVEQEALYKSGINPIPTDSKQDITIMNLLWCLNDANNGKVVASNQSTTMNGNKTECSLNTRKYIATHQITKLTNGKQARSRAFRRNRAEINLRISSRIFSDTEILIKYTWSFSSPINPKTEGQPQNAMSLRFDNIVRLKPGRPVIVNQLHSGNKMYFLVIQAKIVE